MKSKYEISIWTDIYDETTQRFKEIKEVVIGSDTMTSENRARNAKLVNNINGTNQFTFDVYYRYIDTRTGEEVENPYIPYLVNERKIKVLWKDEWYDLLIKQVKEDQANRVFTYTCEDSYITELSRSGFELTFDTELENSIGTAKELITTTLENTDWEFDETSDQIYQLTEEPVYVAKLYVDVDAIECPLNNDVTLHAGKNILVYYSFAPNKDDLQTNIQVRYAEENEFVTNVNEMLVTNGSCYNIKVDRWIIEGNKATAIINNEQAFLINFDVGLSDRYRAERYVDSQQSVYNDLVGRYVNVYSLSSQNAEPRTIYGYSITEYNDALAVVNLVTNACNFKNISGWSESTDESIRFKIWPAFGQDTEIKSYEAKSFLRFLAGQTYINSGIQDNRSYISNGFIKNEKYVFRIHAVEGNAENPSFADLEELPSKYLNRTDSFTITFDSFFEQIDAIPGSTNNDHWIEYIFKCIKSCSYEDLLDAEKSCRINIRPKQLCWLEEAQFYILRYGEKDGETVRINPNELDIQSVAQIVWKYFDPEENKNNNINTMTFLHTSLTPWEDEDNSPLKPAMNNYVSYAMIEESQSNRFNILQSIAEKFTCWVRFRTEHDPETGAILYDGDRPKKYVGIFREAGQETGIGFIYGVDLKGVTRDIKSNQISTKTIVLQNDNEFGKNGFCTIARSKYNYPKENTIYNFDYYIQHGLLNRTVIQRDLYGTTDDCLSYYVKLHNLNTAYDKNLEIIINKQTELTRQESMQTVYSQYLSAARDEEASIKDTIMKLAGASNMADAQQYISTHYRDTKVQSLADDLAIIEQTIDEYQQLNDAITSSIEEIEELLYDETLIEEVPKGLVPQQNYIITQLNELNTAFYKKYARFIQEGTWQSEDYWDDDLYYLDALQVAYESARPKITYEINVLRLSETEEYSSKVFHLGDISFIQDIKYFGYLDDQITPYKERVVLTEITSFFDTPDKDTIKVQNYKNQFDDLFQRITAATQNLEFSEGKYARVSDIMSDDGTIKSSVIQKTFDSNKDLVYGAQNESVTMDSTGITVVDNDDANKLLKVTSGGVFVSADGGDNWRNAVRGDGINTDLLTAGRINTENITVYNGEYPSFRWDSDGINAYGWDECTGLIQGNRVVRFDQYGMYGVSLQEGQEAFIPESEDDIYKNARFGLTWNRFFMRNSNNQSGANYMAVEISTDNDIIIRQGKKQYDSDTVKIIDRVRIGKLDSNDNYGMIIRDPNNEVVFKSDKNGAKIAGWNIEQGLLESQSSDGHTIRISSSGSIGSYGGNAKVIKESVYSIKTGNYKFTAVNAANSSDTISITSGTQLLVFTSTVGALTASYEEEGDVKPAYKNTPPMGYPESPSKLYFIRYADRNLDSPKTYYILEDNNTSVVSTMSVNQCNTSYDAEHDVTTYNYIYKKIYSIKTSSGEAQILTFLGTTTIDPKQYSRYVPAADTEWYIDQKGQAVFHNIYADGGQIAGWWIDNKSLYQTYNGTSERNTYNADGSIKKVDGNVKTQINALGSKTTGTDQNMYTIITDAINAAMATLGGVLLSNGLVNGYNIKQIADKANKAASTASSALSKANQALSKAQNHTHNYSKPVVTSGAGDPKHAHTIAGWSNATTSGAH